MDDEQRKTNENKEDSVVAPGGPRPPNSVHPVAPGETVRRNPDGSYSVVPKEPAQDNKKEDFNG